ncbi:MAG: hypothetical protein IRZ16_19215 [Myxococcaceae bacterium]|nr:hypothetical protein [Myxococcaceae bacterium]
MAQKKPSPPRPAPVPIDDEPTEIGEGLFGEADLGECDLDPSELDGVEDLDLGDDEKTHPGFAVPRDSFEDTRGEVSGVVIDPRKTLNTGKFKALTVAPEVSQGPWRERAFIPRGVVPKEEILESMEQALQIAAMQTGPLQRVRIALRAELMPLLRQAVEQAGGDGLDAWLSQLTRPPGRPAKDPFLMQLAALMDRFGCAPHQEALLGEAKAIAALVQKALCAPAPKKLSLKFLEEEFEGRIEVDALLTILFATDEELERQRQQVDRTLDSMRLQMRSMAGASPDGLMWNFSRLKVEKRIVEAEQKRRGSPKG